MSPRTRSRALRGLAWSVGLSACLAAGALLPLLFGGAASAERGRAAKVSPVIFPPQKITVRFSHKQHLAQGVSCDYCHESINDSTSGVNRNIPAEKTCMGSDCHAIDRAHPELAAGASAASGACVTCHPAFDPAKGPPENTIEQISIPNPNLKFSHKVHRDREVRCKTCHGDMSKEELGTRANLPRMSTCLGCHDGKKAPSACTTCHLRLPDGRVRTSFPGGQLMPTGQIRGDAHDLGFRTEHAQVAQNDKAYCESCHQQKFCLDCHAGTVKPSGVSLHSNDYLTIHPVDARRNNPTCDACHRRQTFCVGCHERSGVGADPPGPFSTSRPYFGLFHPPGWADETSRGPNHHAWQAQRNLRTCASCHRESLCIQCHSKRLNRNDNQKSYNPHPRGWAGSELCRALSQKNMRMCLRCHETRDADAQIELSCQRP